MQFQSLGADESYVKAVCVCGWEAPKRQLLRDAEADGEAHVARPDGHK